MSEKWTQKHDDFCQEHRLPPAAQFLWRWLQREGTGEDIYPDLTEFNRHIEKTRGKPYTRQTLKDALAKLIGARIVSVVRRFCWKINQLIVRPLEWLKPKKNLCDRQKNCDSPTSNPQSADDQVKQQQQLFSEARTLLENEDIHFRAEDIKKLRITSIEEVLLAIRMFYLRGGHEGIANPPGFIRKCLKQQWWYDQLAYGSWDEILAKLAYP